MATVFGKQVNGGCIFSLVQQQEDVPHLERESDAFWGEDMEDPGEDALTKVNISVLSPEQQEQLRQFKIQTRISNEKYLRAHPEVDEIVGGFLRHLLLKRPSDIREFAADHFTSLTVPSGSVMKGNSETD